MNLQMIDKYITEVLHATDPAEKKLIQKRIVDAIRTAQAAINAAELARKNGNEELAKKLEARAAELKELAAHAYEDIIDDDSNQQQNADNKDSDKDTTENGEDPDEDEDSDDVDSSDELDDETDDENSGDSEDDTDSDNENPFDDIDSDDGGPQNSADADADEENDSESDSESDNDSDSDNNSDSESDESDTEESDTDANADEDEEDNSDSNEDSDENDEEADENDEDDEADDDEEASDSSNKHSSGGGGEAGDEDDSDEDSDEDEESDDAPVKDPFADEEDIPQLNSQGPNGQEPRDATLDDIIKELKGLSGESKRGAIQALKDIQTNRGSGEKNESLQEALLTEAKNIRELDDDEYAELINSTLDMIDQAGEELTYSDNTERKAKVKELNNPTTRRELTKEISDDAVKAHQEVKARDQELNKYKNCKTIEEFELNFYNTINAEVNWVKQKKKSWNEINNDYEGEDILVKADVTKKHLEEIVPIIDFYFDVSGSWTEYPDAIKIGQRAVATVKEFADEGLVKLNVYYFGRNSLSSDMMAVWDGGTHCWDQIIANIKKTGATNVVLMTDGDMEDQAKSGPGVKVDGCVWFIWGLGGYSGPGYDEQGHEIPKKLIGIGNNTHYAFNVKGHKY